METINKRNRKARIAIMMEAEGRWQKQKEKREEGLRRIQRDGPGAADTLKRQMEFSAREAAKAILRARLLQERTVGPTLDIVPISPNAPADKAALPVARIAALPNAPHPIRALSDETELVPGIATGFLVSDCLLLTNHHVFPSRDDCHGFAANFNCYYYDRALKINDGSFFEIDSELFYVSDEKLDFALVGVKSIGLKGETLTDFGKVRLIEATGKTETGMPVNIIQHPGGGPRMYAVTNNRLVDILDEDSYLHYETDTARGSSGSPVFNNDWELLALHHSGVPEIRGGEIWSKDNAPWDLDDSEDNINWIANEGIRVSSLVGALRKAQLPNEAQQMLISKLLASTSDPVMTGEALTNAPVSVNGSEVMAGMPQSTFNISGNVTIHVHSGSSVFTGLTAAEKKDQTGSSQAQALLLERSLVFDTDYGGRKGYLTDFLGVRIDLPKVDEARREELYLVSDYKEYESLERNVPPILLDGVEVTEPLVLPYHHYSLVMNKRYSMCMWTATNCDFTDDMRSDGRGRSDFGGENWRLDRRVPAKYQLTDSEIYKPAGNFDRGHINRREDNCWGLRGPDTEYANSDTYHWTNCTPQHELFNRETADGPEYKGLKGVWGYFEAELETQIRNSGGQAVIFAGPVLAEDIPSQVFRQGGDPVQFPLKFWKVVVVPESTARQPRLLAYGFVFDQSKAIETFGLDVRERLALPEFDRQRMSLADISQLSGVSFPANVMEADQYQT